MKPIGGWGNEAIEVMFQAINKEDKVDQVFLICDAPPNNQFEVKSKREHKGEEYWKKAGFPLTTFAKELSILGNRRCPVHTVLLHSRCIILQKNVRQITDGYDMGMS